MKRGLPKVERAVRERVVAELHRSKTLWEEYVKQRRARRIKRAWQILRGAFLLVAGMMAPVFINLLCIGMGVIQPRGNLHPDRAIYHVNGIGLALLLQAVYLTGATFLHVGGLAKVSWQSRKLAVLAFLPVGDAEYRGQLLKHAFWEIALWSALVASSGYGYWAWSDGFTVAGCIVTAVLAVLQVGVGIGLAAWLVGRFTCAVTAGIGFCLMVAVFLDGTSGFLLRLHVEGWTWIGMALTPAGWVNAAFQYGLLQHNPVGWLWLIPAVLLVIIAPRRLRQPLAIREFIFHDRGEAEAIPEQCCAALKGPQFRLLPAAKPDAPRLSEADAVWRIRNGDLTERIAANRAGWLERWVVGRLNARERAVLDCMLVPAWPLCSWTWWWNWICLAVLASLLVLAFLMPGGDSRLLTPIGMFLFVAFFFGPGVTTGRLRLRPHHWLPIGDGEVCRLLWKIHLLSTSAVAPLFLIHWVAATWRVRGQPLSGLLIATIFVYAALAVFPFRLIIALGSELSPKDDLVLLQRMPLLRLLGLAGGLFGGNLLVMVIIWNLQWNGPWHTVAGVVVLPLLALGIWRMCRFFHNRWRGDWLPSRSE